MGNIPVRPLFACAYLAVALIAWARALPPQTLLDAAALVTIASMVARLLQSGSLSLPLVWELGFLTIVYLEVRNDTTGGDAAPCGSLITVVAILVLGHCMAVVAMDMFDGLVRPARPRKTEPPKIARPVVVATLAISVVYLVPVAAQAAELGRVAVSVENATPTAQLLKTVCMIAPTLVALSVVGENPGTRLIKGYLYSFPLLLAMVTLGTRYFLLVAVTAPLVAVYGPRIISGRALLRYGVLALTLLLASSAMLAFRSVGLLGKSGDIEVKVGLSVEGILFQTCDLIDYFEANSHLKGRSALSVAVVLLPRDLWPSKPRLLEYWFPREAGQTGFGPTQSISTAYIGDAYADFGIIGVALYCSFLGLLVGCGQRIVATAWLPGAGDAHKALASALIPLVYFGVRSPTTAAVQFIGFCVVLGAATLISSLLIKPEPDAKGLQRRTTPGGR